MHVFSVAVRLDKAINMGRDLCVFKLTGEQCSEHAGPSAAWLLKKKNCVAGDDPS